MNLARSKLMFLDILKSTNSMDLFFARAFALIAKIIKI